MKSSVLFATAICVLSLVVPSDVREISAQELEIKKGDVATISNMEYVGVKNLEQLGNYFYGSTCNTDPGDTLTVIGIDGDKLLVRYNKNGNSAYSCPSGIIFFITKDEFLKMKHTEEKAEQKERAEKGLIRRLLENE